MNRLTSPHIYSKFIAWLLLLPLLYFAVHGMFSFDRSQYANNAGVGIASTMAVNADSDTLYYRIQRFAMYGIVALAIVLALRGTYRLAQRYLFVFSLPVLAILSTAWSQDKGKTLPLAIMVLCLTLFAVYLCHRFQPNEQIDLINLTGIVAALASYLLIAFVPSMGIRHTDESPAWQGLFVHKNALGIMTVYFFAAAYYAEKRTPLISLFYKIYMGAMLLLVVMSLSRTAWLQMLLLILYFAFESIFVRGGRTERILLPVAVGLLAMLLGILAVTNTEKISLALGKSADMTGRSGIFEAIYPSLWKRPIVGFGYQAFWLGLRGESANIALTPHNKALANAENGPLQMWLELGALGTSIVAILLFLSVRYGFFDLKTSPSNFIRWNCSTVFLSLLMLFNGDKFMYPDSLEWLLFVMAYISLAEAARHTREGFAFAGPAAVRFPATSSLQSQYPSSSM
jgi:exopolysaccharide production protein ExoQ